MKTTLYSLLFLVALCCVIGCGQPHDHGPASKDGMTRNPDVHAALHQPKHNEVLVEFPGHKYAMEIIDEKETTGLVTAILTNAHFEPVAVDAKEVRLNFIIDGSPKTFTLTRTEQEEGKPATFTLTDKELAVLTCEGWQGEATASVEIDGTPYNSKLVKLAGHDHGHAH